MDSRFHVWQCRKRHSLWSVLIMSNNVISRAVVEGSVVSPLVRQFRGNRWKPGCSDDHTCNTSLVTWLCLPLDGRKRAWLLQKKLQLWVGVVVSALRVLIGRAVENPGELVLVPVSPQSSVTSVDLMCPFATSFGARWPTFLYFVINWNFVFYCCK